MNSKYGLSRLIKDVKITYYIKLLTDSVYKQHSVYLCAKALHAITLLTIPYIQGMNETFYLFHLFLQAEIE